MGFLLDRKQAAKMLCISYGTLKNGKPPYHEVPCHRYGKRVFYSEKELEQYINVNIVGLLPPVTPSYPQLPPVTPSDSQLPPVTIKPVTAQKVLKIFIYYCFNDREFKNITDQDIDKWKKAYPAVDIKAQLLRAGLWLDSNPSKSKKNYRRFLTNWFSRSQERGGDIPSNKLPQAGWVDPLAAKRKRDEEEIREIAKYCEEHGA